MQIKAKIRYHVILVRIAIVNKAKKRYEMLVRVWRKGPLYTVGKYVNCVI